VIDIASEEQVNQLRDLALQINQYLQEFFDKCQIILVDFKLEFGVDKTGKIYLGDEISPDTCRLWDKTQEDAQARILDKDRFRRDLGDVETAYQQVQTRVLQQIESL
jgi:phosphoribosylaminoimidazole-succinocarboxamide synthase